MNVILTLSCLLIFRLTLDPVPGPYRIPVFHAAKVDTMLGRKIKTIVASGQFSLFDKLHTDRAFIIDGDGMTMNVIYTIPEMDCFLANHAKDDLQFTYEVHEIEHPDAKPERLNYALRFVSLKTGDDTRTWAQKESNDSDLLKRHHEQLKKVRQAEGIN